MLSSLLTTLFLLASANAYVGSRVSGFGGNVLISGAVNTAYLEMKKGKANMAPQMRSQYEKQKEMAAMRKEMLAATKQGPDGLPVFNLFVRTPRANVSLAPIYSRICTPLFAPQYSQRSSTPHRCGTLADRSREMIDPEHCALALPTVE
jgi:hypothetical protein